MVGQDLRQGKCAVWTCLGPGTSAVGMANARMWHVEPATRGGKVGMCVVDCAFTGRGSVNVQSVAYMVDVRRPAGHLPTRQGAANVEGHSSRSGNLLCRHGAA
eukprot:364409-Chlamydomonas_euryale.AAC.21